MRYPKTPYYTYSPSVGRDDKYIEGLDQFISSDIVITEKIDGSCIMLHRGDVYDRSQSTKPAQGGWLSMVKSFHAYKTLGHDLMIYGEDIYGVHSIKYGPVLPENTFMAFALYNPATSVFLNWETFELTMGEWNIPVVPVLYKGQMASIEELNNFIILAQREASALGTEREGVVIRLSRSFHIDEFSRAVCKSVRPNHVQHDEHWSRNWKPCELMR